MELQQKLQSRRLCNRTGCRVLSFENLPVHLGDSVETDVDSCSWVDEATAILSLGSSPTIPINIELIIFIHNKALIFPGILLQAFAGALTSITSNFHNIY